MTAITYDELIRRVPLWIYAKNRSLVEEMPAIVGQAHEQLINVMDHDIFKTLLTGLTVGPSTNSLLDLSAETPRVLEVRAVRLKYRSGEDDWVPLQRRDLEYLTMLYSRNRPRRPLYYSEYNGPLVLKMYPAADQEYQVEVTANVEPLVLSETNQTNIISTQFSRALEKATMRQACLFQKSWDTAQMYEKEMMAAVTEANAQIQRRRRDETETRPTETSNVQGQ